MTFDSPASLVILGGPGIGVIAASVALSLEIEVRGYLNDELPVGHLIGRRVPRPVLGSSGDWQASDDGENGYLIAFGAMQRSEGVLQRIRKLGIPHNRLVTLVSPQAILDANFCEIGGGTLVAGGAGISVDSEVGRHCALMAGSYLGHDSTMGDFARLAAGAVVGAYCEIGDAVHVGTNATVRERVRVGSFALVGSGSVVLQDVPPRAVVAGNPARIIRVLPEVGP